MPAGEGRGGGGLLFLDLSTRRKGVYVMCIHREGCLGLMSRRHYSTVLVRRSPPYVNGDSVIGSHKVPYTLSTDDDWLGLMFIWHYFCAIRSYKFT